MPRLLHQWHIAGMHWPKSKVSGDYPQAVKQVNNFCYCLMTFGEGGGVPLKHHIESHQWTKKKKEKEKKNISPMKVRQWRAKYDTLSISDQNPVSKTPNDSSFHPPSTNSSTICERLFALEDLVLTDWILIRIILICKTQLGRGNRYLSPPTTTHLTSSQRTQRGFTA